LTERTRHNPHPAEVTEAQARRTAIVVAGALAMIAAWSFYRQRTAVAAAMASTGAALLLIGMVIPSLARRFHVFWMKAAVALGWINSRVLLTLMFHLVFAPYGFVSRLVGRDPLYRRGAALASYWTPRRKTRQAREGFERLF
jgi:hypothetical protein